MTTTLTGHCHYCGRETPGLLTCRGHRDLPAIDPHFKPDVPQNEAEPAEDFRPEALLDRLQTKGA